MRPLVEDAIELGDLGEKAYRDFRQVSWQHLSNEAMDVYVVGLRMPTMLFERLAEKMKEVEADVKRPRHTDAGARSPAAGHGVLTRAVSAGASAKRHAAG